jgi:pilus assembly protein Flp/PilA
MRGFAMLTGAVRFLKSDDGTTAVEYAVMLALIVGLCVTSISFFGGAAGGSWQDTCGKLSAVFGASR